MYIITLFGLNFQLNFCSKYTKILTYADVIVCFRLFRITISDGLVVSVSASHAVGRGLASWSGHTKDHDKRGTIKNKKCISNV